MMRRVIFIAFFVIAAVFGAMGADNTGRRDMVLRAQALLNLGARGDVVGELEAIADSLGQTEKDGFYFATLNVLVDRLFSESRFAEADSAVLRMENEALSAGNPLARAMSRRVRGQMLYKLSQPEKALVEFDSALAVTPDFRTDLNAFSTFASINEWRVIVARALGDTTARNDARTRYAAAVDSWKARGWRDSTAHFEVTALAFKAPALPPREAQALMDSAARLMRPDLPARAYEHYWWRRAIMAADSGDYGDALAAVDVLLKAHESFIWFYLDDLRLKARILALGGRPAESLAVSDRYTEMRDSLTAEQIGSQLADLSTLYRTKIEREHRRAMTYRLVGIGGIAVLLLLLLIVSLCFAARQRRRNRLLVDRLKELDRPVPQTAPGETGEVAGISRLDAYMMAERPYVDPSFGRQALAKAVGMSPEQVAALVRDARSTTVLGYINSHRLDEARRVLESDSDETLTEIAGRLGFGTLRTFQRTFSERYAMPPSRYRTLAHEK